MIDLAQLPDDGASLAASDFAFRTGNNDTPAGWTPLASPTPVVRLDEGDDGGDRIVLTWPDETIRNTWLEVTVRATAATGLAVDEVLYYGNAIGETGNASTNALVTAADVIAIRDNPRGAGNRADVINPHDINRDAQVNATDLIFARNGATSPFDALRLITP